MYTSAQFPAELTKHLLEQNMFGTKVVDKNETHFILHIF
jgi:hypothetical protein